MNVQPTRAGNGGRTLTIHATFEELTEALGYPEWVAESTDKVDVEWNVKDTDTGRTLAVWNYKNGPNYRGENGTPVDQIEKWSAGGDKSFAEDLGLDVESMFS